MTTAAVEIPRDGDFSPHAGHGHDHDGHDHDGHDHDAPVYYVMAPPDPVTRFVTRLWQRSPVWAAPIAALVCLAGGVVYTLVMNPAGATAFTSPTCLVKITTGFDCPGCGGTRAFWYVLHGDLPAAARSHLLFVFCLPYLLYLYVAWSGNTVFKWKLPMLRLSPTTISIFLAAWGVFAVARNLPWAPFTWFFV